MDGTATLFNKPIPCKILNSTVWLLRLRSLSLLSTSPPPKSRGKVLCKKRGGRKEEYLTIICLWQAMFYLNLRSTQTAKPGRPYSLTAELVQHVHPRLLSAAPSDPRTRCISLHLPLSHIRFSSLHCLSRGIFPDIHTKHVCFNTVC